MAYHIINNTCIKKYNPKKFLTQMRLFCRPLVFPNASNNFKVKFAWKFVANMQKSWFDEIL